MATNNPITVAVWNWHLHPRQQEYALKINSNLRIIIDGGSAQNPDVRLYVVLECNVWL